VVGARRDVVRLTRLVGDADDGRRVADVLCRWLPEALGRPVARARVRAMIAAGAVSVDGARVLGAGRPVRAGQRLDARVRPERLMGRGPSRDRPFTLSEAAVLYRDDVLLAVDKPPGLPTHATADPSRPHLVAHVERFLVRQGAARPYVAVHQRLDRDTSGIVLFATDRRANQALARAFGAREVAKTYAALTARPAALPPRRFRIDRRLDRGGAGGADGVHAVAKGGQEAATTVRVREILPQALLVEATPLTGRRHQVRVHLAEAGLPILGDTLYGPRSGLGSVEAPRLMLHARRLELRHPLTGARLVIESPLPPDFARALAASRRPRRR
jgi:23S rRNA pseudouridine1911/1915/1917 synthase